MTESHDKMPDDEREYEDDPAFRELLQAYELPAGSPARSDDAAGREAMRVFTDEVCMRIQLQRHDPAAGRDAPEGFADRVTARIAAERAAAPRISASPNPGPRISENGVSEPRGSEPGVAAPDARAPASLEMRSRLVPYLVAAALMIATGIALWWPKGPGPTMPKITGIAAQLDARLRSASDPVSHIGGLVPVADFAQATPQAKELLFEIPRFAPPSLHDFEAADTEARALENSQGTGTNGEVRTR